VLCQIVFVTSSEDWERVWYGWEDLEEQSTGGEVEEEVCGGENSSLSADSCRRKRQEVLMKLQLFIFYRIIGYWF